MMRAGKQMEAGAEHHLPEKAAKDLLWVACSICAYQAQQEDWDAAAPISVPTRVCATASTTPAAAAAAKVATAAVTPGRCPKAGRCLQRNKLTEGFCV